jgi:hypothetical protein
MTTASFRHIDQSSYTGKPWTKVDGGGSSFTMTSHQRNVINLRGQENAFHPNKSGFGVYYSPATEKDFTDDAAIRSKYYPEVEALVKDKMHGVKKVIIFDHTVRRRDPTSPRQPVQQVHIDQTPQAAATRVKRHAAPEEVEELLKGRYQIINVWRPIGHAASDFPLAVVDWTTMKGDEMINTDLLYPTREDNDDGDDRGKEKLPDKEREQSTEGYEVKGETYGIAPSDSHKFYYMKDMTPEEAMFLKIFDSRGQGQPGGKAGVAIGSAHTAFEDVNTPKGTKGRQSIEVRCLVFYDE